MRVELYRRRRPLVGAGETDDDGRIRELAERPSRARTGIVFHPPSPFFTRVELEVELGEGHHHVPLLSRPTRARATAAADASSELAELFEGRTRFVERLAALDDPLGRAREVARALTDDEKKEVLDAHPAIGARTALSARSAAEQGTDDDPACSPSSPS